MIVDEPFQNRGRRLGGHGGIVPPARRGGSR
jgi:hypothetical protein